MDQLGQAQKNTSLALPHFNDGQLARDLELKRMEQQPLRGYQAEWTRPQIESEQVARLEEKVKHLQSLLMQKQSEVDTMNKWQFGDQYLGQDDVLKDQMNEYKARVSVQQEKDVQEMADAAYQTV